LLSKTYEKLKITAYSQKDRGKTCANRCWRCLDMNRKLYTGPTQCQHPSSMQHRHELINAVARWRGHGSFIWRSNCL